MTKGDDTVKLTTKNLAYRNVPFWAESVSGDEVLFEERPNKTILAVIDGTGHGNEAHQIAAQIKSATLSFWADLTLNELLIKIHQIIHPSIGASIGLFVISNESVKFAGVGNIAAYVIGKESYAFSCNPGAIGSQLRNVSVQSHKLIAGDVIILHSDGIKSRLYTQYDNEKLKQPAKEILDYIFNNFAKQHDDASCVVYRF